MHFAQTSSTRGLPTMTHNQLHLPLRLTLLLLIRSCLQQIRPAALLLLGPGALLQIQVSTNAYLLESIVQLATSVTESI